MLILQYVINILLYSLFAFLQLLIVITLFLLNFVYTNWMTLTDVSLFCYWRQCYRSSQRLLQVFKNVFYLFIGTLIPSYADILETDELYLICPMERVTLLALMLWKLTLFTNEAFITLKSRNALSRNFNLLYQYYHLKK